jgi:putative transposase
LGKIVAFFKYQSTKQINQIRNTGIQKIWQRNYYDRIIRNEKELNQIRQYIFNNPAKWGEDDNNPDNVKLRKL